MASIAKVEFIDLTADDFELPAPRPTKRRNVAYLKAEAVPGLPDAAQTGPIKRNGAGAQADLQPAAICLCDSDDDHEPASHGKGIGGIRGQGSPLRRTGGGKEPYPQTRSVQVPIPAPPASAAAAAPAAAAATHAAPRASKRAMQAPSLRSGRGATASPANAAPAARGSTIRPATPAAPPPIYAAPPPQPPPPAVTPDSQRTCTVANRSAVPSLTLPRGERAQGPEDRMLSGGDIRALPRATAATPPSRPAAKRQWDKSPAVRSGVAPGADLPEAAPSPAATPAARPRLTAATAATGCGGAAEAAAVGRAATPISASAAAPSRGGEANTGGGGVASRPPGGVNGGGQSPGAVAGSGGHGDQTPAAGGQGRSERTGSGAAAERVASRTPAPGVVRGVGGSQAPTAGTGGGASGSQTPAGGGTGGSQTPASGGGAGGGNWTSGSLASRRTPAAGGPPPGRGSGKAAVDATSPQSRHETWRKLHDQDRELAAQRGELEGLDIASSLRFVDLVHAHNKTLGGISDGAQAAHDAVQHHVLSGVALQASVRLERLGARTPQDIVTALRAHFPAAAGAAFGGVNWQRLGATLAAQLFRPARGPVSGVLLGPLDVQPKPRRVVAQRRKPELVAEVTRPKEYVAGEGNTDQADSFTNQIMEQMLERMRQVREAAGATAAAAAAVSACSSAAAATVVMPWGLRLPAAAFRPWVEVILDHAGFTQTVENNHAVGHLLKDDWLLVRINDDCQLTLAAMTKEEHLAILKAKKRGGVAPATATHRSQAGGGAAAAGGGSLSLSAAAESAMASGLMQSVHFIMPLEMADWRAMCQRVPAGRCVMPSRQYADE